MSIVTPLPPPPQRIDEPEQFALKADAFLGALPDFGAELNLVAEAANDAIAAGLENAAANAATAASAASTATTEASTATTAKNAAEAAEALAEDWAVKMDGPVSGGQFSARYWATQAETIVGSPVTSVAGRTGAVVLSTSDISGLGTAATKNVGTSGDTIAQPNGAITWSAKQTFGAAVVEKHNAIAASAIDLALGNFFSKTIAGATTFTVSNVPASGAVASVILELTNGGSAAVTWWDGVKWAGGTAPTLTAAGRDILGFFTRDGDTTWTGLMLSKDAK